MVSKNYYTPDDIDIYNDYSTYVLVGNDDPVNHVALTIDSHNIYQKYKKVLLFVPCFSNTIQSCFRIKESTSSSRFSCANKVVKNNIDYLQFDLTQFFNIFPSNTTYTFLLLNSGSDFSIPNYDDMFLQVVCEEPFDYLATLNLIERKIGNSYLYQHDIVTSYGFLSKNLYENSYPYPLKLVFDMYEPNVQHFSFLPKGWTINLLEKIIANQNSNSYTLIDGDFVRHKFSKNSNSSTLIYVDTTGTGLLMEKVDSTTFKVFSPINTATKFYDGNGRIIKSIL